MRVSKEQAAKNRERVLETAGRLFRKHGFGGIGLVDLMKEAGLTHGGFYGQFKSKEDLIAQVCRQVLETTRLRWENSAARRSKNPLTRFANLYLTSQHRDTPGAGCLLAALSADVAREGETVRQAYTEGLRPLLDHFTATIQEGTDEERRKRGITALASMMGAIIMSRAVADSELSQEILQSVRETVVGLAASSASPDSDGQ